MRPFPWVRRDAAGDSIEIAVEEFVAGCREGGSSLERFWSGLGSRKTPSILAALVKVDLQRRFEAGQRPDVMEYLETFPILAESRDRVVSLVYEEFCLLEENGEHPDCRDFCERYGPWRDSLLSQLAYHRELSRAVGAETPAVKFPELGERFDKYQLRSLLGEGGVARVYLATEDDLGGRQLAIKVSAAFGQEPSILAKLDHRNIVPILTVAQADSGLLGICMPYRPGVTLEDVIRRLGRGSPPRPARAIFESLKPLDPKGPLDPDDQRVGWADFPIQKTFPEAVAWIGLALANALAYLHGRGVFHRDIKPANVLMAYREGPQLLDFNLAQDPSRPEGASAAQKGGTLPYMAPEQLKAFLDPSTWEEVKAAADLYSLGLVLRELVTGRPPEVAAPMGSLPRDIQALIDRRSVPPIPIREINPGVPPALESIIGKCLEFRPADRYAGANDLASDLKKFLDRQPLDHAPNPSAVERGVNLFYRNRHLLAATFAFFAVALALYLLVPRPAGDGREDFKVAGSYLDRFIDSGRKADLDLAQDAFETLHEKYPNSARASLGLVLALWKHPNPDRDRINPLIQEAIGRPDAREAFEERLLKEPGSPLLLSNLGCVLTASGDFDRARERFQRALENDPNSFAACNGLGDLEAKSGRPEESVRIYERAIGLRRRKPLPSWRIYEVRLASLSQYRKWIDGDLEARASSDERARTATALERMKSAVKALGRDRQSMTNPEKAGAYHSFYLHYFEGCLRSMTAALMDEPRDPARSSLLKDARGEFNRAEAEIAPPSETNARRGQLDLLEEQGRLLKVREGLH